MNTLGFFVLFYLNYVQYSNFGYNIWDLGQTFSLAYQFPIPNPYTNNSEIRKMIYLIFVPIVRLFPSPFSIIIFEDITISITAFVLFVTSVKLNISPKKALVIMTFYLFNYAFLGPIFDPGHYQYMFPFFFSFGFYFISRGRPILTTLFFTFASLASDLAAVTILIFGFLLFIETLSNQNNKFFLNFKISNYKRILLSFLIMLVPLVIILLGIYFFGSLSSFILGGHVNSLSGNLSVFGNSSVIKSIELNIFLKLTFTILILIPYLLFLPSSKYTLLLFPYFILLFLSSFIYYGWFEFSYPYNIGVILFIIVIDVEQNKGINNKERRIKYYLNKNRALKNVFTNLKKNRFITFVIIVVLLNLLGLPYSPINQYMPNTLNDAPQFPIYNFQLEERLTPSIYSSYISSMILLIPQNASVLVERNLPQLADRNGWQDPGLYEGKTIINYTLIDPYAPISTFLNIEPWYNKFVKSGSYGVLAEEKGIILLKRFYEGPPIIYTPYSTQLSPNDFTNVSGNYGNQSNIESKNISNYTDIFSNCKTKFFLPPGQFNVKLNLSISNNSSGNSAIVMINECHSLRPVLTFNGSAFRQNNVSQIINFTIENNFFINTWIVLRSFPDFNATLRLTSISITQISTPHILNTNAN